MQLTNFFTDPDRSGKFGENGIMLKGVKLTIMNIQNTMGLSAFANDVVNTLFSSGSAPIIGVFYRAKLSTPAERLARPGGDAVP